MAKESFISTSDRMQDLLLDSPGFPDFLLGLATISAAQLATDGRTMECTITVERDGGLATVAASSQEGYRLDETQYGFDIGPCLTALRQQRTVLIDDLASDLRWSRYLDSIAEDNVRSVLAVPIHTNSSARAALNSYAYTTHAFDPGAIAFVEDHAASMSRILRLALRLHAPDALSGDLRSALKSRAVVDAAVSLVMLQTRGGRNGALTVLQTAATSNNKRIQEIAAEIVDGGYFPGLPDGRQ